MLNSSAIISADTPYTRIAPDPQMSTQGSHQEEGKPETANLMEKLEGDVAVTVKLAAGEAS